MTTLLITFTWEDEGGDAYDELMQALLELGADNIIDEPAPPPVEDRVERPKKRKT